MMTQSGDIISIKGKLKPFDVMGGLIATPSELYIVAGPPAGKWPIVSTVFLMMVFLPAGLVLLWFYFIRQSSSKAKVAWQAFENLELAALRQTKYCQIHLRQSITGAHFDARSGRLTLPVGPPKKGRVVVEGAAGQKPSYELFLEFLTRTR